MKLKDYIRQMDDEELAAFLVHAEDELHECNMCVYSDEGVFCNAPRVEREEKYCTEAMRELLEKDVEDPLFDDFFCR